jgi:hypothetical protein
MATPANKYLPVVERVKTAIDHFEKVRREHADTGACDSEPDAVWQSLLTHAIAGDAPTPPRNGEGWELFVSSMDCSQAAQNLFDAALKAIQEIESCPIRDIGAVREYIQSYCWRRH